MSEGGRPLSGVAVEAQLWPSVDTLSTMDEGSTFELRTIAQSRTDSAGRFALAASDAVGRMVSGGSFDVDVVARGADGSQSSYSLTLVGGTSKSAGDGVVELSDAGVVASEKVNLTLTKRGTPDASPGSEMLEMPTKSVHVTSRGVSLSESDRRDAARSTTSAAAGFPNGCPVTGTRLVKKLGDRWVNVGNAFSRGVGKQIRFTYAGTADSSLGVGVSFSGKYGSFSRSGTVTRERTLGVGWPLYKKPKSRYLDTLFSYGKYCTTVRSPGPSFTFRVKAIRHQGGTRHRNVAFPSATHCVRYRSAGSESSKRSSNAMVWLNGAKLGGAIGIDLSSRTGFRSDAFQYWKFVKPGRLCGQRDKPAGSPRVIAMKPKNW